MNAFDSTLHDEFPRLLAHIDDDDEVHVVVLTGAGKAFSAGGDTANFVRFVHDFPARRRAMRDARRLVDAMMNTQVPVIAAVNGPAVGLGCTLATLCDMVFISERAFLADPHVSVGLVAGDGGAVTWPSLTSLLRAKEYLLSGDRIPAATAVEMGLANYVVPPDDLMPRAMAYAQKLAALPPQAVQDTKALLNQVLRNAAVAALGMGIAAESQSHDTIEYRTIADGLAGNAP
jgi:enoyl-CoA hydratase/carnithine racemase